MFRMAFNNLKHRRFHTVLALSTVVIATSLLFSSLVLGRGVLTGLTGSIQRMGADVVVIPVEADSHSVGEVLFTGAPANIYMRKSIIDDISTLPGVKEVSAQFFTQTLNESCCSVAVVDRIVGFDPATDFVVRPWLDEGGLTLTSNQIVLGAFAPSPIGGKIGILGEFFTVAGRLKPTGGSVDTTVFMFIDKARELAGKSPTLQQYWENGQEPDQLVSAVLLKAENTSQIKPVIERINRMQGVNAIATSEVLRTSRQQFETLIQLAMVGGLALWIVCLLGLMSRYASYVVERKKEFGLLRALGAGRRDIFVIVLVESLITTLSGGLAGLILGWLLVHYGAAYIRNQTAFAFLLPSLRYILLAGIGGTGAAVVAGLASALYPAWRCAFLDPVRAISEGELE